MLQALKSHQLASGHPHVVPLLGIHEDSQSVYLLIESCPGGPLLSAGNASRVVSVQTAARYTFRIASAMKHCDLKRELVDTLC